MGNNQPKKLQRASKGQIDIACLKSKFHLELYRDRKNNELIKGEKELVMKLQNQSRNKVEEVLIAERVTNGLKQAQGTPLIIQLVISSWPVLYPWEVMLSLSLITKTNQIRYSLGSPSSTRSSSLQTSWDSVRWTNSKVSCRHSTTQSPLLTTATLKS